MAVRMLAMAGSVAPRWAWRSPDGRGCSCVASCPCDVSYHMNVAWENVVVFALVGPSRIGTRLGRGIGLSSRQILGGGGSDGGAKVVWSRLRGCRWHSRNQSTEVGKGILRAQAGNESETGEKVDYRAYQALMRGGEEVISMMKEMMELLEDTTGMGEEAEQVAVEMAATGAVGQRLDKLDESFLMALDYMIKQAERDDKQRWLLEVIKDTVLAQLAQKFPSQVQIVGILCRTPDKDARQEVLRRCAGGGGTFDQTGGGKVTLPAVNLDDIANQADDLITTMEEKPSVPDRRLLARLVLVREEARSLLSGGLQDERSDRKGLKSLPEPEVNFLTKIAGLRPGPELHKNLANVMGGLEEGADLVVDEKAHQGQTRFISKNKGKDKEQPPKVLPVRPGLFLQTTSKVLGGMYDTNAAGGVTVQRMEWTLKYIKKDLQERVKEQRDYA